MATQTGAFIPEGIWSWALTFSLHTLWIIKIPVDHRGMFTPVESEFQFHSPRLCFCRDWIQLPAAGSHWGMMHTCTHTRSLMKDTGFHPNFTPGTVTWRLLIGQNVLSSSEYLGQLLIFPLPWKNREKYCRRCGDVRLSAPFYSRPVRVHYYKPYWFPDFHLICLGDALLLTLYDLILFYWKGIVILWSCSLLWRCCKLHSFKMKSWIT